MANLKETQTWEAGIYQLETTDPVVGGADGVSNKQASQLANRTAYLKGQIEANQNGLNAELAKKRNITDSYNKSEVNNLLNAKLNTSTYNADKATFATKTELNGKANTSHGNHVPATQTANNAIFLRNDNSWASVTPANIGAYTKTEVDSRVNAKYNSADMTAAAIANKGVLRDNNGDIQSRALKCTLANQNTTSLSGDAAIVYRMNNSSDSFLRFCSISTFRQAIGLGNVDNTSDADKPVSTATQTALNLKLNISAYNNHFANSKSANGYTKLPNGLILQWGVSEDLRADNQVTLNFPIAFPNHCLNVLASTRCAIGNDRDAMVQVNDFSTTQVKVILQNLRIAAGNGYYCHYFAIGY